MIETAQHRNHEGHGAYDKLAEENLEGEWIVKDDGIRRFSEAAPPTPNHGCRSEPAARRRLPDPLNKVDDGSLVYLPSSLGRPRKTVLNYERN